MLIENISFKKIVSFTKEILSRIKCLGKREIREVLDFIDFIPGKKEAEPFICYIKEKADRKISLAQVRQELSSIKGSLSDRDNFQET